MIIVSPYQISDDTAEAGAAKPIQHTRIRRGFGFNVHRAGRQALTHFSGIASGTDPDNITFTGFDSEKVV